MNSCQGWQDLVWPALDGELDEVVSAKLVAHVRGCSACRDEMNRAIRMHRAVLMDAVGITGAATAPTIALSAVRSPGNTPRAKRTSGPAIARIPRRRASGNRFVMPVAIAVSLLIAALTLTGPGVTQVAPAATATSHPNLPMVVTVSATSADTVGRLTLAIGVRLDGHPVTSGTAVQAEVPVVVDGSACLLLNDGTTLQLASGTQLAIHRGGQRRAGGAIGVQVVLATGRVDAEVTPQRVEAPMVVTSPVAEVTVVGTTLQVLHDVTGSRIQVAHGQVRVTAAGMSERLLSAGESLAVPMAVPMAVALTGPVKVPSATALVSFIVNEKMNHDGVVPQWCDQLALDPQHPVVAVPSAGDQPPHYKVVNGHPALCVDGETRSLTFPLTSWNSSLGLTLFIVARPAGSGAGGDERLIAVSDATGEHLAVLRSRSRFGLAAAGNSVFEAAGSSAVVLTCTWSRDGAVALLCDHRLVASTAALVPALLSDAVLDIARGPQGKRFEGNVFLLEVQQGVPSQAALHQRIDDLLQVYGTTP